MIHSIEVVLELLKNIEISMINAIKESVLTCECLANGKISTKILHLHLEFE